jgi:hypothetical protein
MNRAVESIHIIVTGLPASGKSSVGKLIASNFGLELLDKDDILESMFDDKAGGPEVRRRLSRDADGILRQKALESTGAVLVSWWRHPKSRIDTGTPTDWLSSLNARLIQVHCRCDALVAANRFHLRKRHPGHLDDSKTLDEIVTSFRAFEALGLIDLGIPVVGVDTSQQTNADDLFRRIAIACGFE